VRWGRTSKRPPCLPCGRCPFRLCAHPNAAACPPVLTAFRPDCGDALRDAVRPPIGYRSTLCFSKLKPFQTPVYQPFAAAASVPPFFWFLMADCSRWLYFNHLRPPDCRLCAAFDCSQFRRCRLCAAVRLRGTLSLRWEDGKV